MLASRNLRHLASQCRPAPLYTWSIKARTPGVYQTATTWYVKPPTMMAAYSTNPKDDSRIQPPNIKMPSREQVEKYFFTALVYVWDFSYYVFCLTLRLIDTYVLKNPTLQANWKKLMKRLDDQRQAIKSKK